MSEYLVEVKHLKTYFPIMGGVFWHEVGKIYAVDDVSFTIREGETLGLVGESGCGKTTLGRTIDYLYKATGGDVLFQGRNIFTLKKKELYTLRRNMQMIFQDPFESLNPRHTIGAILEEPFLIHSIGTRQERKKQISSLLEQVGLPPDVLQRYPHEFSGGQRQRIGIARALTLQPKLIICDEPVSALDVSIQSQILNLLVRLQETFKLTYLFIAHDLAVVKYISDRIAVMYLGKIVELTGADEIYRHPVHPYTQALISAIPVPDPVISKAKQRRILKGDVPSSSNPPPGCRFHTRCPMVIDVCREKEPPLLPVDSEKSHKHLVACHRAEEIVKAAST
ncbi:MAG: ATP-binding cassette domain-containing protein [Spirochaetales bacterium]|nr:ATP-binding cassette domain-containing protein [Spirochaetales bacterium]